LVKFPAVYTLPLVLSLFSKEATAQASNSLLQQLTITNWEAPFFDVHIDFDTLSLHKIDPGKTFPRTKSLRFLPSGHINVEWYHKKIDHGCGMDLPVIDNDSSYYSLKGDTLRVAMKGEYIGVEEFHFERDYLIEKINNKEIRLSLIKTYSGQSCEQLAKYRKELSEATVAVPPHPNSRKKQ